MATKPTPEQVAAEIVALAACKAYAPNYTGFGDNNHRNIDLQIEYLKGQIDISADDEWEEFSESEQTAILEAQSWKDGMTDDGTLSSGWDSYKPKEAKSPAKKKPRR